MTETPPEQSQAPEAPEDTLAPAPKDAPEDTASGYAVYDRTLQRYVGGVTTDKPSRSAAAKLVGEGHTPAVVRV